MKTDQYNNPIPTDLVILNLHDLEVNLDRLTPKEVENILQINWYEAWSEPRNSMVFVSAQELQRVFKDVPAEDLINESPGYFGLEKSDFLLINRPLKRFNSDDGFYSS
jgi:hypothetical protein